MDYYIYMDLKITWASSYLVRLGKLFIFIRNFESSHFGFYLVDFFMLTILILMLYNCDIYM